MYFCQAREILGSVLIWSALLMHFIVPAANAVVYRATEKNRSAKVEPIEARTADVTVLDSAHNNYGKVVAVNECYIIWAKGHFRKHGAEVLSNFDDLSRWDNGSRRRWATRRQYVPIAFVGWRAKSSK